MHARPISPSVSTQLTQLSVASLVSIPRNVQLTPRTDQMGRGLNHGHTNHCAPSNAMQRIPTSHYSYKRKEKGEIQEIGLQNKVDPSGRLVAIFVFALLKKNRSRVAVQGE